MYPLEQITTFTRFPLIRIGEFVVFGWTYLVNVILNMLTIFKLKRQSEKEENSNEVFSSSTNRTPMTHQSNVNQEKAANLPTLRKRPMIPQGSQLRSRTILKKWKSAGLSTEDFRRQKLKSVDKKMTSKSTLSDMSKIRDRRIKVIRSSRMKRRFQGVQEQCEASQTFVKLQVCSDLEISLTDTENQLATTTVTVRKSEAIPNSNHDPEMDASNFATKYVPCQQGSEQDLDRPLAHYYIKGSHNTYLMGNQLTSASTIEGYRRAIANKCKSVELDLHDGPDGEPLIYHGWTLTTAIVAREVLEHGIKPNFCKDDLPLILDIEDNMTSVEQRQVFIQQIHAILGEFIYVVNIEEMACLPSPNQLKGKIIIKAPREKWGELANICQQVPFPYRLLEESSEEVEWYGMSSLSEHKLTRLLQSSLMDKLMGNGRTVEKANKGKLRVITADHLVRCYPGGQRQLSGNFDPIPGMNAGCQIAAMNIQTKCKDLAIYESKFNHAGHSGYALKPAFLIDHSAPRSSPKRITINVISGHHLPQTGIKKQMSTFVIIHVDGEREDKAIKFTRTVEDDGLYCQWGEELRFDVGVPELGFLLFQVKRSQFFGLHSWDVASFAIPVANLVNGPCFIPLHDSNLVKLEGSRLLIHVTIEDQAFETDRVK